MLTAVGSSFALSCFQVECKSLSEATMADAVSSEIQHIELNVTGQSYVRIINEWTLEAPVPKNDSDGTKRNLSFLCAC